MGNEVTTDLPVWMLNLSNLQTVADYNSVTANFLPCHFCHALDHRLLEPYDTTGNMPTWPIELIMTPG
jgi:hypothetical protein